MKIKVKVATKTPTHQPTRELSPDELLAVSGGRRTIIIVDEG